MKLTGLFKRGAAYLCTAAILMGGVSAFALSPALPDEPAPAELSVTNAVSEAQLRSALSKLTVTYDSEAEGWQIDSPYEEASMEKASCGLYPYLFVTNDDPTVYLSLGMTYFGNKKLDMKSVRVETEDNYYDFTCDEEFIGGYDNDLKAWFDYELFDMDDSTSWLNEWLAAKSVTATFTGKDLHPDQGQPAGHPRHPECLRHPARFRCFHCPRCAAQPCKVNIICLQQKPPERFTPFRGLCVMPYSGSGASLTG